MSQLDRQSFLGPSSSEILANLKVGLVGLGGGGSHVAQQLAHLGIGRYALVDPDIIEETNLNRLVSGLQDDLRVPTPKVRIAERTILGVLPWAKISSSQTRWQEALNELKDCDVVIGGLDSVRAKDELERFCRRFLIPYIDMGMDVHEVGDQYLIAGQVVLSSPGGHCLRCMGIVTEEGLEREGARYGAAGGQPQVIWPNGVLASLAVGLLTQMVTPWHRSPVESAYLEYDGNRNTVSTSCRLIALKDRPCLHYASGGTGDPMFDVRRPWSPPKPERQKRSWWQGMEEWVRTRLGR